MILTDGSVNTLTELIRYRAELTPGETAVIVDGKHYSREWLWRNIQQFASLLAEEGVSGKERILVLVPNGITFFIAFYGCILSGAIAVPVFPNAGTERCTQLMGLCGSRQIILPANIAPERRINFIEWSELNHIKIHTVDENALQNSYSTSFPKISEDDIAFIQYTSGSTDFPKGVPLTHRNLLTNVKQMIDQMNITTNDVFVSWLPVYHDMGLILNTMVPFYTGAGLVLLEEGLHKVHSWLKAIEEYKGTFISAPDVAYRLCVKSIRRPSDYNLSSLRVALNASEPIHEQTYHLFEESYSLKNVMVSGYGLAEATVAVTMHPPSQPPVTDKNGYVSSGKPLQDVDIKIDRSGFESDNSQIGEILVKSPAVMEGYYNIINNINPFDENGYLRTGDIGYIDNEDNLFVLARKKNIIKHAGHTLYPDDVEQVVKTFSDIRQVAVIGVEKSPGVGESLYVFAEYRWQKCNEIRICHELIVAIVQKIHNNFGVKPGKVYIVKPKTIPHTPNGKLQHAVLKKEYILKNQKIIQNILYP